MIISLIVAMDLNRGIGYQGRIPWHLPSDLMRFKALTMGHHIIMGRKTFESIGKMLPGRISIVISRRPEILPERCLVVSSLDRALEVAREGGESEAFVIGGAEIFYQAIKFADRVYMTIVCHIFPSDVFFPLLEEEEWYEIKRDFYPRTDRDPYDTTFRILMKKADFS